MGNGNTELSGMHHTWRLRVRYADTDQMGIVYYARYLDYFEVARTELLRAHDLPYRGLEADGYLLPVLEAFVKYIASARYDDELELHTTLTELRGPVLHIEYKVLRGEELIATGHTEHAFVRAATGKPCKPPAAFIARVGEL